MLSSIKKYLGFVWILIAILTIVALIVAALQNIDIKGKLDINKPMPWIIIIVIFIPVAFGLALFGWYAIHDEYASKD